MDNQKDKYPESIKIESIESDIRAVIVRMMLKDGSGLILRISERGLEFYGRENDARSLSGSTIVKTPEQVFEWIKGETPVGGKKAFGAKKGLSDIGSRGRKIS